MDKPSTARKIIPDDQIVVVFDTSPIRSLAYVTEPPDWAKTFVEMSSDGYSFSLSDGACAELINQRGSGALNDEQARKIVEMIEPILNKDVPVFLGKMDILEIINCPDPGRFWNAEEFYELSKSAWQTLKKVFYEPVARQEKAGEILQEERDSWVRIFDKFRSKEDEILKKASESMTNEEFEKFRNELRDEYCSKALDAALDSLNKECNCRPPMSVRCDLQMRLLWRQYVRSMKEKDPYNPESKKKRNDGIDFDLCRYFLLPALVVADESGFFDKIKDIESFQLPWFLRPQDLADMWVKKLKPRPSWPA